MYGVRVDRFGAEHIIACAPECPLISTAVGYDQADYDRHVQNFQQSYQGNFTWSQYCELQENQPSFIQPGRPSGFYWYIFFNIVTIWLWNIFISWTNGTFMLDMYDLKCFKFELHLKIYIFMCLFRHIISVRFSVGTSVFHGKRHLKTAFHLPFSTFFPFNFPSACRFSVNNESRNDNENGIWFLGSHTKSLAQYIVNQAINYIVNN